jgi:cell division protein FtsB
MVRRSTMTIIKSAALPAVALFVIADFAGFAIFGANGVMSWAGYHQQKIDHLGQLEALKARRAQLEHHAALLDPAHVDPDLADEIVRRETRQVRPDEVILATQ